MDKPAKERKVLVTGGAGFIGSHLIERLLKQDDTICILDNFNSFYTPDVKRRNIQNIVKDPRVTLVEGDIRDETALSEAFAYGPFDVVVHLAAMAGVRPSLAQPAYYMDVNVNGTQKVIDMITRAGHDTRLVFGSSSSVYGNRSGEFFVETDRVDQPLSPYAASKAAGELLCYSAHHTRNLPVVCLRFFTVFGPRQRPDLAIHKFCQLIDEGKTIEVFGDGKSKRDYTFVSDIVDGIMSAMTYDFSGFDVFNLGRSDPVVLMDMIGQIEKLLGKKAKMEHKPMPLGDMPYTFASIEKASKHLGYSPKVSFEEGMKKFVDWYLENKKAMAAGQKT